MRPLYALALVLCAVHTLAGLPAMAVQPDEVLSDPALESRARAISRDLRCPICQGESIDDSNAQLSRDLRLIVRERLVAGDSDTAVIDFVIARYGEFVLFNPRLEGANIALWAAGPLLLILGGGGAFIYTRRRAKRAPEIALSDEEKTRLNALLKE